MLIAAAVQADAASPSACPGGATAVSTYAGLQTDVANAYETSGSANAVFCLTASVADSASTSGGLVPDENDPYSVTIDLNGYNLSITHAGTGNAGITTNSPLVIEDTSSAQNGVLTADGGAASTSVGAGPGIGNSADCNNCDGQNASITVLSGTVNATGGSASTTGTNVSGAGAGIGGGGGFGSGTGSYVAGQGGELNADGGTINATGGSASGTTANDAGAGAGIGGGGGENGGQSFGIVIAGGTVNATGGNTSSTTSGANSAGAGAGIGGGGGGFGGTAQVLHGEGGTVSVTPGTATNGDANISAAQGVGGGGSDEAPSGFQGSLQYSVSDGSVFLAGTTTTISGQWAGGIQVYGGSTVAVKSGGTLTLSDPPLNNGQQAEPDSEINGTLQVPASSTLSDANETLEFASPQTIAGTLNIGSGGALYPSDSTLEGSTSVNGILRAASDQGSALTIPAGATLAVNNAASTNQGTIDVGGTLTGTGSLDNSGNIALTGTGSIPGNGQGKSGQLTITGNIYKLTFSVPSPGTAPASMYVFADTVADGSESLPAEPAVAGYSANGGWESGTTPVGNSYALSTVASANGTVSLMGLYQAVSSVSQAPGGTAVSIGSSVSDTVTVVGNATYGNPTGSVDIYVCGPLTSAAGCSSTANQVGGAASLSASSGNNSTATSAGFAPTQVGTYCFYAVYGGDGGNVAGKDAGNDGCFTVANGPTESFGQPTTATVTAGNSNTDVATIFGAPNAGSPTGTVTFFECGPSSSPIYCESTGNQVGSAVTLSPGSYTNGTISTATATSPAFTAPTAGTYCFYAVYSGDAKNFASADGSSDSQCYTVTAAATTASAPTSTLANPIEGESVQLSTVVTPSGSPAIPNSGEVTFFVNGHTTLCTAQVIAGDASCQTSGLPEGTDSVTARYEGNASFSQSPVSSALSITVSGNSAFTAAVASNTASKSLAVKVALHSTGALKVAASLGKRTVTHSQKVTLAKTAKTTTVSLRLALKSLLRGHSGTVKVRLAITFKPTVGKARTVIKTVRIRIAKA